MTIKTTTMNDNYTILRMYNSPSTRLQIRIVNIKNHFDVPIITDGAFRTDYEIKGSNQIQFQRRNWKCSRLLNERARERKRKQDK